jgi:hypothetical protein
VYYGTHSLEVMIKIEAFQNVEDLTRRRDGTSRSIEGGIRVTPTDGFEHFHVNDGTRIETIVATIFITEPLQLSQLVASSKRMSETGFQGFWRL